MIDGCRDVVLVRAASHEEGHGARRDISLRHPPQGTFDIDLPSAFWQAAGNAQLFAGRDVGEQFVNGRNTDAGEHRRAVLWSER
jgi:hypothetical protein